MQTFKIEKTDSQCVVSWRYYTFDACVLAGFMVFAGIFVSIVMLVLVTPILVALPLGGLWSLLSFVVMCHTLFGNTKIVIDESGLVSAYTCLILKREKRIDLAKIRCFEKIDRRLKSRLSYSLRAACQGGDIDFSLPTKDFEKELDDLCNQLNVFLGTLKAEAAGVPAQWAVPEPIMFDLDSPPQHLASLPNSRWHYQTDFNGIGVQKRGEDKIGDIIGSLLQAVFVNGIVWLIA